MKTSPLPAALILLHLVLSPASGDEKPYSLRHAEGGIPLYITATPGGGLKPLEPITSGTIFIIVDDNDGDLVDGDMVQIKWVTDGGKHTSYWSEGEDLIRRITNRRDESTHFLIKKSDAGVAFQAASGKFIVVEGRNAPLRLSDDPASATYFELMPNLVAETKP